MPPVNEETKERILDTYEKYDLTDLLQTLKGGKSKPNEDGKFTLEQS